MSISAFIFRPVWFAAASALLICSACPARAETQLRVASWNTANFHHEPGVELRPGIGTKRQPTDFEVLKRYADKLEADLIALQEIGTKEAAHVLFPAATFDVIMESRYTADIQSGSSKEIYTAVAVRKRGDVKVVEQKDITGLEIEETAEDGTKHVTRRGTALKLDVLGTSLWFVSVHLKSSCSTTNRLDTSVSKDCQTLWQQRLPLKAFIDQRTADGTAFIIAGDFNRRFRQFQLADPLWTFLNGGDLNEPLLVAHPETVTRKCPTRLGTSTQPIDWLLMDARVANWFQENSYWETRYSSNDVKAAGGSGIDRLSDHCPIQIDLKLPSP